MTRNARCIGPGTSCSASSPSGAACGPNAMRTTSCPPRGRCWSCHGSRCRPACVSICTTTRRRSCTPPPPRCIRSRPISSPTRCTRSGNADRSRSASTRPAPAGGHARDLACATTAWAWTRGPASACSIHTSPPRSRGAAPASACPSCTAWSRRWATGSMWTASQDAGRRSPCSSPRSSRRPGSRRRRRPCCRTTNRACDAWPRDCWSPSAVL